jgi:hypothetical protein
MPETPIAIQQLGQVIGPSIGIHVSECAHGGFVVIVDGAVHSAWTNGWEVREALGQVMAQKYSKSFTPPAEAKDVTPAGDGTKKMAERFAPKPAPANGGGAPVSLSERTRSTVSLALMVLAVSAQAVVGV